MRLGTLKIGEKIAAVSAVLLFVSMFFHWFGVEAHNTSNLLFQIEAVGPGMNAWEALDYIPFAILATIVITLAVIALRLTGAVRGLSLPVEATVAILGLVSTLLIVLRIIDPPVFLVEPTITYEGAAQWPAFVALVLAAGIALGGCLAVREELARRRARRTADV